MVAIPISEVVIEMGTPSEAQLAKIQPYRPKGTPAYVAEELFSATFRVASNLIRVDQLASHQPNMLEQFAATLPGKPLAYGHRESGGGRFYDSQFSRRDNAPRATLNSHGHGGANREIVRNHSGYFEVWGSAFMPATDPLAEKLRYAQYAEVSMGPYSLDWTDRCPECTCDSSMGIWSRECPFIHPANDWAFYFADTEEEIQAIRDIMPAYVNRTASSWYAQEASIVFLGAIPDARLPREGERVS